MKVLVCGSRHFNDYERLSAVLEPLDIDQIIEGGARGADTLARKYGEFCNIPVVEYLADWNTHGKRAGPIRNSQMLREGRPNLVVAFWDGKSPGTKDMIAQAEKAGVKTIVINI